MVTIQRDFYSAFTGAGKAHNIDQQNNMLLDEVAALIVHHKDEMIELLRAVGAVLPKNPSNQSLITASAKQFTNPKFQKGLAYLIAKRSDVILEKRHSASGDSSDPIANISSGIASVSIGAGSVYADAANMKSAEESKKAIENTTISQLTQRVQSLTGVNPKSGKAIYFIIGGIIAIGAIMYFKKKE